MDAPPHVVPPLSDEDRRLIERAGEAAIGAESSTQEGLRELTAAHGVDFATAALFRRIRFDPRRAAFFERIESPEEPGSSTETPHVVIMPGAFAAEYPHTGADGARVIELARRLGWAAERVKVPSFAPMADNARVLSDALARSPERPVILVSLSKGAADVRAALAKSEAFRNVRTWVNLSGLANGTPLVDWLRARPLRRLGVRTLLRLRGQRFATVEELRCGSDAPLGRPLALPSGLRTIHVAGFPLHRHLSDDWARRGHARLAPLGPNDGGGALLADFARLPGDLYPVWGADHYLRPPWDVGPLLLRILLEAARPSARP